MMMMKDELRRGNYDFWQIEWDGKRSPSSISFCLLLMHWVASSHFPWKKNVL